jgi:hypothetical protein
MDTLEQTRVSAVMFTMVGLDLHRRRGRSRIYTAHAPSQVGIVRIHTCAHVFKLVDTIGCRSDTDSEDNIRRSWIRMHPRQSPMDSSARDEQLFLPKQPKCIRQASAVHETSSPTIGTNAPDLEGPACPVVAGI